MFAALRTVAGAVDLNSLPHTDAGSSEVQTVLQIVFGIVGALALLFIVISGFRYIISTGDPQDTAKAKNGIIYSLVGLVLALSAEAIVTWVLNSV